jgi:hypothetical protein
MPLFVELTQNYKHEAAIGGTRFDSPGFDPIFLALAYFRG